MFIKLISIVKQHPKHPARFPALQDGVEAGSRICRLFLLAYAYPYHY